MPTKRTRQSRPPSRPVTWDRLDLFAQLCLLSGWTPPSYEQERASSPWASWGEFLDTYEQVRGEWLTRRPTRPDGRLPFAERVRRYVQQYGRTDLSRAVAERAIDDPPGGTDGDDDDNNP